MVCNTQRVPVGHRQSPNFLVSESNRHAASPLSHLMKPEVPMKDLSSDTIPCPIFLESRCRNTLPTCLRDGQLYKLEKWMKSWLEENILFLRSAPTQRGDFCILSVARRDSMLRLRSRGKWRRVVDFLNSESGKPCSFESGFQGLGHAAQRITNMKSPLKNLYRLRI